MPNKTNHKRVAVVSLHKTGTTSISLLLSRNGYIVTGPDRVVFDCWRKGDFKKVDEYLELYTAYQDDPWYLLYPYIYDKYPDTKFIYLERDESEWLESVQNFYARDRFNNRVRRYVYGHNDSIENAELYLETYRNHRQKVLDFFKDKPNSLISIDIKKNEDYYRLKDFLELTNKRVHRFPLVNKGAYSTKERWIKKIKYFVMGGFGINVLVKRVVLLFCGRKYLESIVEKLRLYKARIRAKRVCINCNDYINSKY